MAASAVPNGTYPVQFAPSALTELQGKKNHAPNGDLVAFRYAFKPASVTCDTPGTLEDVPGADRVLSFDLPTGGSQVFDIREESSKPRECVLIWDEESQAFKLHALPTTLHLSQNRTLSAKRPAGGFPAPSPKTAKPKRAATSGKGVAKKQMPAGAAPAAAAATKKKPPAKAKKPAAAKKTAAKKGGKKAAAASQPASKVKSVEIIEDSDDDGMDEFADMLGAAIEEQTYDEDEDDEDDEDDVEEDEDDELGGARFAGYEPPSGGDGEEWI